MKIRKAGNDKFVEGVCKMIAELGAKKVKDSNSTFRSFELETIVGKLEIKVETDNVHCFSVFTCFENVEKAKVKFPCNPHSGKYNFHLVPMPYKKAIAEIKIRLEDTLPKKEVSLLHMKEIQDIILRKEKGIDCTESESAEIKGFIKEHIEFIEHFGEDNASEESISLIKKIENLFPCEMGEAIEENSL